MMRAPSGRVQGQSRVGAFLVASVFLATLALKLSSLPAVEPGTDQATFARWVLEIMSATHVVPEGVGGVLSRTMADSESLLFKVLHPLYSEPHLLMTLLPLFTCVAFLGVFGFSAQAFVAGGVGAHVGVAVLTGFLMGRVRSQHTFSGDWWAGFAFGFIVISINPYLHWFATLGIHNVGILAVCAVAFVISRDLPGWASRAGAMATLFLASFCHWTVPLLTIPALVLFHLDGVRSRRPSAITNALLQLSAVSVAPALALVATFAISGRDPLIYAAFNTPSAETFFVASGTRFLEWLHYSSRALSIVGLVAGVTGLAWHCLLSKRLTFLAAVLVSHVALWSFMPGFTFNGYSTAMRTFPYVLPSLIFGVGFLSLKAWSRLGDLALPTRQRVLRFALSLLLASGAYQVLGGQGLSAVFPDFHRVYFANAGVLGEATDSFTRLSAGKRFWTWNYDVQNKLIVMNPALKERLSFQGSLGTLATRLRDLSLDAYLIQRSLNPRLEPGTLVVVPAEFGAAASRAWADLCGHLREACASGASSLRLLELPESGLTQMGWQVMQAGESAPISRNAPRRDFLTAK